MTAPERIWLNDRWEAYLRPTHDGDTTGYIRADLVPDPAAIREAALREAARLVSARCDAYVAEHGSYDYSTGITEYPGNGADWVEEWIDIESAILALIEKEPKK